MELPVQVQFRNMQSSEALEGRIVEKAQSLLKFCSRIMHCRVVIEASHRHHQYGVIYHVSIELAVPGGILAVSREREIDGSHKDPWVAARDAFMAMRRRLEGHVATWREFPHRGARSGLPAF